MSKYDVVRAWKDPKYRAGLSAAGRAAMRSTAAGDIDLSDDRLDQRSSERVLTVHSCDCGTYIIVVNRGMPRTKWDCRQSLSRLRRRSKFKRSNYY
jgi:mersacidin/lichenicidin family type 2 lantibiotic